MPDSPRAHRLLTVATLVLVVVGVVAVAWGDLSLIRYLETR